MGLHLTGHSVLKQLEKPSVYNIKNDDLYELDHESFEFLRKCSSEHGCDFENEEFINYCINENILTKTKTWKNHPEIKQSPIPSLRYLELQITDSCNLRCKHCYIEKPDSMELSTHQIKKILHEFQKMQGLRVLITGGEPLIHSNFDTINDLLPDFRIRKVLFSNGLLISKKILSKLNVEEIQISIDGLESGHDALRGKGTFKKAFNALELVLNHGLDASVSTMAHSKNLGDFDEMHRLFTKIGIKEWTVDVPCITGRLQKSSEFYISPEKGGKYLSYGYGAGLHSSESGYGCGLHLMSITAAGSISKCTFYSADPVGKIDDGLEKCWKRIKPIILGSLQCNCEFIETCRGGCRYRAELFGNALGKDPYRCALYIGSQPA
ncbi:MAG: radical SAM protein [Nitrospiraceae bacterium]|nr:radical SAM protein [Nitrospiraceae bacterium]